MIETSELNVEIKRKAECIYSSSFKNEGNDLNSLISNLKLMQQKINDVLTKLVEAEKTPTQDNTLEECQDDEESEEEDKEDEEEENLQSKKCKYK